MDNARSAARIKARCKENGIAVSALLETCGVRKSSIYDMEKRDWTPSAEIMEKIAEYRRTFLLHHADNSFRLMVIRQFKQIDQRAA